MPLSSKAAGDKCPEIRQKHGITIIFRMASKPDQNGITPLGGLLMCTRLQHDREPRKQ